MAPKNRRRGSAQAGKQNGGSGGNGNGNGNGKGRGRGRGRGRGSQDGRSSVLDLTPQNAAAAGPGPFGMGMGMGAGMMGMSPMGSMPFGQLNPTFGYGLGGATKNAHTVTVKLSLEGAARAQSMEQMATLGMWQKQMAVQNGTPLGQHPQWDTMHSMYIPLQNTQPQQSVHPSQLHTTSTFVGSMQQQGVVPPPAGDDDFYDFGEGDEDEADDAHDQLMAVEKRQECIESFMRTQITSYLNDSRYVNDASGAYTACMVAATAHADLSTPSRDKLLLQRGINEQVTTTLEDRLAEFQKAIVAQIQGAQHIAAPPLGGHPGPGEGTNQAQAQANTHTLALCNGGEDVDLQSLGGVEPGSQSEAESFGLNDVLYLVSKAAPVPPGGSEDNMLSPQSGKSTGADALASATKSPYKKARSEHVAHPLNVLRAALMHVPVSAGTHAIQGIPKDFGVRTQALCDTIAGLIKKAHSKSEFETLLEDFKIFEKRSQGAPSTYECRVSHILYILTRGMAADPTAKCSVSFSDFVAVPTVTPVTQKMPGATPCPRPGCKCTDKLARRNKYCCSTCAKGVPCTVDQHFTTEVVAADPTPSSARGARRGRPRIAS